MESIFGAMRESLSEENRIEIRGFVVLGVKDTKAKTKDPHPGFGGPRCRRGPFRPVEKGLKDGSSIHPAKCSWAVAFHHPGAA